MSWRVVRGDCIEAMAAMEPESVHAVVCDPPYGLEFMGKEWDSFAAQNTTASVQRGTAGGFGDDAGKPWDKARSGTKGVRSTFKCRACGGWSGAFSDARRARQRPCDCEAPDYDYAGAPQPMLSFQAWCEAWAREALRVLKPGGFLLAFGGTRTVHRLTSGIEDAGFEIRDRALFWGYGSGFPKSLDVSKAIDKAAGAEREREEPQRRANQSNSIHASGFGVDGWAPQVRDAVTPEAQAWEGWGTALKPAYEPVVVARKPLSGTVAANVVAHGTGALNIAACRIGFRDDDDERDSKDKNRHADFGSGPRDNAVFGADLRDRGEHGNYDPPGRWPANVLLDEHAAAVLDAQTGELHSQDPATRAAKTQHAWMPGDQAEPRAMYGDSGGASRFFYVAKASSAERNAGLDGFEATFAPTMNNGIGGKEHDPDTATPKRNVHPTVKPIEVMRWLVRLVCPPGGTVLDPFAGSGTTGIACVLEGFDFVGVEREPEYADIAEARIRWWEQHPEGLPLEVALAADGARRKVADTGQVSMFDLLGG